MDLREIVVRPVRSTEEARFRELMEQHHYLGALPKISETLWYVATWREEWMALLRFSASALKCAARDRWVGWDFRHRYSRLKLVVNNSRFLILPDGHRSNLGSRVLALCEMAIPRSAERRAEYAPTHAPRAPGLRLPAHDRKRLPLTPSKSARISE